MISMRLESSLQAIEDLRVQGLSGKEQISQLYDLNARGAQRRGVPRLRRHGRP